MSNAGYQLPEDADTENAGCMLVFYPDKDEYRRAVLGSLSYLATWGAWERESNKNGRVAARLFKETFEMTLNASNCFGDIAGKLDTIIELLGNDTDNTGENETVNISNILNCCCGGGSGPSGSIMPPNWGGPPDGTSPETLPPDPEQTPVNYPPGTPTTIGAYSTQETQCAMASYLLYVFRSVALGMADRIYTSANVLNKISEFYPGNGLSWGFAGGVARFALFVMSYLGMMGAAVGDIAREIDRQANAIKCAMLNPDLSPSGRLSAIRTFIDLMALPLPTRFVLRVMAGYLNINLVWDYSVLSESQIALVSGGHFASGCPPCVEPNLGPESYYHDFGTEDDGTGGWGGLFCYHLERCYALQKALGDAVLQSPAGIMGGNIKRVDLLLGRQDTLNNVSIYVQQEHRVITVFDPGQGNVLPVTLEDENAQWVTVNPSNWTDAQFSVATEGGDSPVYAVHLFAIKIWWD
jgi:hypothetical protein